MYPSLTKKQKDILEYIKVYNQLHGYSPSLEEIKDQFRLHAISTVHEHIQNLKKKGYIYNEINQARSIKPIDPTLGTKEFADIPLVYSLSKNENLVILKSQKTFTVHKDLLHKDGTYIAVHIDTDEYNTAGIFKDDVLILKETAEIKRTSLILASTKTGKSVLVKTLSTGIFEPIIKNQIIPKNICIKAVLCDLIRKYV